MIQYDRRNIISSRSTNESWETAYLYENIQYFGPAVGTVGMQSAELVVLDRIRDPLDLV